MLHRHHPRNGGSPTLVQNITPGIIWGVIAIGVGLRLFHLLSFNQHLHADEAITGLMGKHILASQERPIFYYGQHYLGAIEAYLVALSYALFGLSPFSLRLVPFIFSVCLIQAVFLFGRASFDRQTGLLSASLVAIPSPYFFDFLLKARGGFGETVLLIFLLATFSYRVIRTNHKRLFHILVYGFLTGLLFFIYQAVLLHIFVILFIRFFLLKPRPSIGSFIFWLLGFIVGALPLLVYNIQHPFATFLDIGGKYLGITGSLSREHGLVGSVFLSLPNRVLNLGDGLLNFFHVLAGIPGSAQGWLSIGIGVAYTLVAGLFYYQHRERFLEIFRQNCRAQNINGLDLVLILMFLTFLSGFMRPRYLLVCYPLIAILVIRLLLSRVPSPIGILIMCLIWSFNCIGTVSTFSDPPRKPYDALVNYLRGEHLKYGYTGYYTAYPVVFLSNEDIILSPRAGPIFLDRYEPYSRQVDKTQNACYIFFSESRTDALFAQQLQRLNTEFKKVSVGAWNVYSDLPPNIRGSITLPVTAGN